MRKFVERRELVKSNKREIRLPVQHRLNSPAVGC